MFERMSAFFVEIFRILRGSCNGWLGRSSAKGCGCPPTCGRVAGLRLPGSRKTAVSQQTKLFRSGDKPEGRPPVCGKVVGKQSERGRCANTFRKYGKALWRGLIPSMSKPSVPHGEVSKWLGTVDTFG